MEDAEIRRLEEAWTTAVVRRDEATLLGLVAEDFTFTSSVSAGGVHTRTQYLDFVLNVLTVLSFDFTEFRVRRYGDVAIVNTRYHQRGRLLGDDWDAEFLLTDVWVQKGGGRWQVVARHSSQPLQA